MSKEFGKTKCFDKINVVKSKEYVKTLGKYLCNEVK